MVRLEKEVWKSIQDFPGYEVSNLGRVRSFWKKVGRGKGNGRGSGNGLDSIIADTPQKILKSDKPNLNRDSYPVVTLSKEGKTFTKLVHRLVLETFVGSCPEGMESRHKNNDPGNPDLTNLCWELQKRINRIK